ncbi:hypothetical protein Tco_0717664 [Tanacetum coccineum]
MDVELPDLHDRCYVRQAIVDNAVNRRSRELLQVIKKLRGEFDVMRNMKRAREEECEGLQVKCDAAMTEFEKNPAVSKVTFLEVEKARLEVVEVSLRKEVEELKQDMRELVSKVIPYATMELVHSDNIGSLFGRIFSSAILYGRCRAYEQVANMKEPFDLSKVKGYRSSYKKDHTQANNEFSTATLSHLENFSYGCLCLIYGVALHWTDVGIKSLLDAVRITAAQLYVNTASEDLVLLIDFKENMLSVYYC